MFVCPYAASYICVSCSYIMKKLLIYLMSRCVCVCTSCIVIVSIHILNVQNKGKLRIHEDSMGNIYVAGATDLKVSSEEEVCYSLIMHSVCTLLL